MAQPKEKVIEKPKPVNWKLAYDKYKKTAVKDSITPVSYRDYLIGAGIQLFEKMILAVLQENLEKTKT